ncbi:SulP family inorganic anion transporter [Methyloligella solikamskensis]|uniref:SulP family inorganic anion transporter n=1 Tax=Methyloligella solikamskensis TaxID=1177756 RepID=A0ABW3J9M3_9HYPH
MSPLRIPILKRPDGPQAASLGRDVLAGGIAGVVQIAYCISFSALIFQGSLAAGFPLGLASLLMGTIVTGVIVSLTTSLVPSDAGPDTPAVAVMSVLATTIAATLASQGASQETIIINVLLALVVSTFFTGLLLFGLGAFRAGQFLRFVPYPVIGGFLAASGWLLMTGGIEVITGTSLTIQPSSWFETFSAENAAQLGVAGLFALTIVFLRRWVHSFLALPIAFVTFMIVMDFILFVLLDTSHSSGWFLASVGELTPWSPIKAAMRTDIDWTAMLTSSAEIGAVCGVTAISMLLDVSSLEVARQKTANLDRELRVNGLANLLASVFGGVAGNLSLNGSILINEAGAVSRLSGVFVALTCGLVLFVGLDVGMFVPKAVLGGMLAYLGVVILVEALFHAPAKRSYADFALALAITIVICYFGYLLGVVLGVIGACLMFALSYSRIGVIRRHLTRQEFAGNVERAPDQARILREEGGRIHIFWLSGFIFFGSSNGLFERVRRTIDGQAALIDGEAEMPVGFVVLDFGSVSGFDTSAVLSLIKLRNYCDETGVTLVFSGLDDTMRGNLARAGFFEDGHRHRSFRSRNEAIEWCEEELLREHAAPTVSHETFESWIKAEFGELADLGRIEPYLDRCEFQPGDVLFRQGEPSDSVDMIAEGCVAVTVTDEMGRTIRLRRMVGQTVVGEMGFYRDLPRTADVVAEQPTLVFRLSRESFEKMREKDPAAAAAFHQLIVRLLADRLDFANREISALLL